MSNEVLLKTLGDTLHRIEGRKAEAERQMPERREQIQWADGQLQKAEERHRLLQEQTEAIAREMETLRMYMEVERTQSQPLMEQFDVLRDRYNRARAEQISAADQVRTLQGTVRRQKADLAAAEHSIVTAQREWAEISERITRITGSLTT